MDQVKTGDPLRIRAGDWNQIVQATNMVLGDSAGQGNPTPLFANSQTVIKVKNTTGTDLDRYDVLQITSVEYSTGDAFEAGNVVFSGSTPDKDFHGNFCVLQEPLADAKIGRAVVSGLTLAKVDSASESTVDLVDGDTSMLASSPLGFGRAKLLFSTGSGDGYDWGLILLGGTWGRFMVQGTAAEAIAAGASGDVTLSDSSTVNVHNSYDHSNCPDGSAVWFCGNPEVGWELVSWECPA